MGNRYCYLILLILIQYIDCFRSYKSLSSSSSSSSLTSLSLSSSSSITSIQYEKGEKLGLPKTIEEMMKNCAIAIKSAKADSVKLALIEIPIPVTGGTELDDWPGGIRQKYSVLQPMLMSMMKELGFSEREILQRNYVGEYGLDDGVGIWEENGVSIICFPNPETIPLLIKMSKLNDNVLVIVNNQFFLDPLSSDVSKSFLSSGNDIYKLDQLNMKGPGALPCRGVLFRQYPNSYVTARRLDNGDYIILDTFETKPERSLLEEIFFEDSKTRDAKLSFTDKLKRFVPNFGN